MIKFRRIDAGKSNVDLVNDYSVSIDYPARPPEHSLAKRRLFTNDDTRTYARLK